MQYILKLTYGFSAGQEPKCPRSKKFETWVKKKNLYKGLNLELLIPEKSKIGITNKIRIASIIAITPANLFGIDRSIA